MSQPSFQQQCDQLSHAVDEVQFERFRWDRDEAPKIARMIELTRGALEGRRDFELSEEGATSNVKRFVVKVHGKRTIAIAISLENGHAVMNAEPVERSHYTVEPAAPVSGDYSLVNEEWIESALAQLFTRIRVAGQPQ